MAHEHARWPGLLHTNAVLEERAPLRTDMQRGMASYTQAPRRGKCE